MKTETFEICAAKLIDGDGLAARDNDGNHICTLEHGEAELAARIHLAKMHMVFQCSSDSGSEYQVTALSHEDAMCAATKAASLRNNDLDINEPDQREQYLRECNIVETECLTDGSVQKWDLGRRVDSSCVGRQIA